MPTTISIIFIAAALFLLFFISIFVIKDKIPVKYAVIWYLFSILILLIGIVPDLFVAFAHLLGFETMSNFLALFVIALLILLNIALTIMIASQRRRINFVSQELSLLKKEVQDVKNTKK